MRRFIAAAIALIATSVVAISPSSAALISLSSSFGPNTIIRDTDTGLEWLALSVTEDLFALELLDELESGGAFASFQSATQEQFADLARFFSSTPLPLPLASGACTTCDFDLTQEFIDLFQGSRGKLELQLIEESGVVLTDVIGVLVEANPLDPFPMIDVQRVTLLDQVGPFFLVRAIAEPPLAALLAAAFAAMIFLRRRA